MSPVRVVSRRRFLYGTATAGSAAALAGCASAPTDPTAESMPRPSAGTETGSAGSASSGDVRLVDTVIAQEAALLGLYAAVGRTHRDLRRPLARLVAQQDEHIARLRGSLADPQPRPRPHRRRVSGSRAGALEQLRRGASDAQSARRADALAAQSGPLARLLASMSASHAVAGSLGLLQP